MLAVVPAAPPSSAMGGTIGCTVGPGDSSCTFLCPPTLNGWILRVRAWDFDGNATITGTCGEGVAACTTAPGLVNNTCTARVKTHGIAGVCTLDDHEDPPAGDAFGYCTLEAPAYHDKGCPHPSPHAHTYGFGGSVGARSDAATGGNETGAGLVTVFETNTADCDGDGIPGDYDGDWETGVGGGFFGHGPWANETICNYGLAEHGDTVTVTDIVHGSAIAFVIGADDTGGPVISTDPVSGETTCSTDGSITPCDPVDGCGTTGDSDDCLTQVFIGTGTTCGAGGDGGYWVFLSGALVTESGGNPGANNAPTAGTITA